MTPSAESRAGLDPCPRCGARAGMVWVHGHGQCAACGSNVHDCCQGADCDLASGRKDDPE
ncbi:MAG: hypothetical protein RL477_1786 [Pseudomonadota bacterium]|jgi:hypothetical protein